MTPAPYPSRTNPLVNTYDGQNIVDLGYPTVAIDAVVASAAAGVVTLGFGNRSVGAAQLYEREKYQFTGRSSAGATTVTGLGVGDLIVSIIPVFNAAFLAYIAAGTFSQSAFDLSRIATANVLPQIAASDFSTLTIEITVNKVLP